MRGRALEELQDVIRARADAAQLALAALTAEEARLRARIEALRNGLKATPVDSTMGIRIAAGRHDLIWKSWADAQLRVLTAELARCLARKEDQKLRASLTLGKQIATDRLRIAARAAEAKANRAAQRAIATDMAALTPVSIPGTDQ